MFTDKISGAYPDESTGMCVFHVHDEIVLDTPRELAKALRDELQREMEIPADWCSDLLAVPVLMDIYGK